MSTTIFDSHRYVQRLLDAGVSSAAATVHAETLLELVRQLPDPTPALPCARSTTKTTCYR